MLIRKAKAEGLTLTQAESGADYGWFADLALSEAQQILNLDAEEIMSGGYHIYTGFDPAVLDGLK